MGSNYPRRFGPSRKGITTSCSWRRQIFQTRCTAATAWGTTLYAPRQSSPRTDEHRGGGRNRVAGEVIGLDCWVNMFPRDKRSELQTRCLRPTNVANWGIPATINPISPTVIGGGTEPITWQVTYRPGGPQHGHCTLESPLEPTGCRLIGIFRAGGSIGSFSTAPLLPQAIDVEACPSGGNLRSWCDDVLVLNRWMFDMIGIRDPQNFASDHFALRKKLLQQPTRCHRSI